MSQLEPGRRQTDERVLVMITAYITAWRVKMTKYFFLNFASKNNFNLVSISLKGVRFLIF